MATRCLLVRIDRRVCALRLEDVEEVFRPLPTEPVAGAPPFVLGLAVVRGRPTPVVDLARLLGAPAQEASRYVSVRAGRWRAVLATGAALGFAELSEEELEALPPLLREVNPALASAIGRLDRELLTLVSTSHLLPEQTWEELRSAGVH